MSADIFLNIDRIVLHGMGHVDGKTLAASLQQALVEQLELSSQHQSVELARVQTQISLPGSCGAGQMGRALAESLAGVISNSTVSRPENPSSMQGGKPDA